MNHTVWRWAGLVLAVGAVTLAPVVLPSYYQYLACLVMINVIMALGLNVLTGNSGQISLCHSSFMAIGAYLFTILSNTLHWNLGLCALIAILGAALGGWVVGYPARRLAGIYLALATLAFLALTQTAIEEFPDLTGGIRGLKLENASWFGVSARDPHLMFYIVAMSCGVCWYSVHCLMNFPLGRAFDAIRTVGNHRDALHFALTDRVHGSIAGLDADVRSDADFGEIDAGDEQIGRAHV